MPEAYKARLLGPAEGEPGHEYIDGVPARHITESEWEALSAEQRKRIQQQKRSNGQPLYEVRTAAEMHPAQAASRSAAKDGD